MSPEDVVNMALDEIRVGANVQSINPSDGTYAGDVASRHYQPRMDSLSRSAHWNCLRFQSQLTILKARRGTIYNQSGFIEEPPYPWLYMYLVPADPYCLKVRFVYPGNPYAVAPGGGGSFSSGFSSGFDIGTPSVSLPATPLTTGNVPFFPNIDRCALRPVKFNVAVDFDSNKRPRRVILTDVPYAYAVYTARVTDPTVWDPMLVDGATMTLAAWMCQPLSGSTQLQTNSVALAKQIILSARLSDGDEGFESTDNIPDWIRIRSSGVGGYNALSFVAGWDAMGFPGGVVV